MKMFLVAAIAAVFCMGNIIEDAKARSARFLVTAYCSKGVTASGTYTRPGTVAVDPRVIRFGTRISIIGYGSGVALDTGSAVKGYHIDIWMPSCSAARAWGVRYKTILW